MTHSPILALAPNGAYKQKIDHHQLPLSEDEIVRVAVDAFAEGVSLLHLHIRDDNHRHSLDPNRYRSTMDAIRDRLGHALIIQMSSESGKRYSARQQASIIRQVNPEAVSIALREIVPEPKDLGPAQALFNWCAERQCRPQFILYSEAELLDYLEYRDQEIIPAAPHSLLFVLGRYHHDQASHPEDLNPFLRHVSDVSVPWMVCAFGAAEQANLVAAMKAGGHPRTGFETSLHHPDGSLASDNIDKVRRLNRAAAQAGLRFASPEQAREALSIRLVSPG